MMMTRGCETSNPDLAEMSAELEEFVRRAAVNAESLHEVEQAVLGAVLKVGRRSIDLFIQLQGDGDLGPSVSTEAGKSLHRSEEPTLRTIRTVFGLHSFEAYTYASGPKKKIELRPVDARMSLPEGEYSHFLEEVSQYFCVEEAFGKAQQNFERVLGQRIPIDSLEGINRRLGPEAEAFMNDLSPPPPEEEGEVLVVTADGKGVPMIREETEKLPAFRHSQRRGNRRVATLAGVYSVDRYARTAEAVVAGLFREERPPREKRPEPRHKRVVARFAETYEMNDETIEVSGLYEAWWWAANEVRRRRQRGQPLVRLADGQESLWEAAEICQEGEMDVTDILDIVHVSSYVWRAARAFCGENDDQAEAFTRDRLLRILQGEVEGVVLGLRQMATKRRLGGRKREDVMKVCSYFENNAERMRYHEYLAAGYPIATGVIEGACRHLVKDRMERSGMRWVLEGAKSMLAVRALHVSNQWDAFQEERIKTDKKHLHPHSYLLKGYTPTTLAS